MADILGIIAVFAALHISDIPFDGPVGAVRIGKIMGTFVINPDLKEIEECDCNLVVAGTDDAVVMVEGGAQEMSEADLLEAIDIAHAEIRKLCKLQNDFREDAGKGKRAFTPPAVDPELKNTVNGLALEKIKEAITIPDKIQRQNVLDQILREIIEKLSTPERLDRMQAMMDMRRARLAERAVAEKALAQSLQLRVAEVDKKLALVAERPTVFYEIDASDPNKPYTAGSGTFIDLLIARAGGVNVAAGTTPYPQLGLEQLVVSNPAILLLGDSAYGVTAESVAARPGWEALAAVQVGKIFPFDDNLMSRPGPRLVDGLEELAKLLHPELFE